MLFILTVHWFADFVMQTRDEAMKKANDFQMLLSHTGTYAFVWFLAILLLGSITALPPSMLWFAPITFILHTLTDYYTSKINKRLWMKADNHNFFVSVGFDQLLHFIQLFVTYWLLL